MTVSRSTRPPVPAGLVMTMPPSSIYLGDRIPKVSHARHVLEGWIGEIAPGNLTAAFEQMSREGAGRQTIPVVVVSMPNAWISGPSASAELATRPVTTMSAPWSSARAIGSAPRYRLAATILVAPRRIDAAGFARGQFIGRQQPGEVITFHDCNSRLGEPLLARHRQNARGSRGGIGCTEVADDLDPVAQAASQHRADEAFERRIEPASASRRRSSWDSARVRSASVSKIRKCAAQEGPPAASATGRRRRCDRPRSLRQHR